MNQFQDDYYGYSIRRVNPFSGIVQIAQSNRSRAISRDGKSWEIQIKAKKPDDMWGIEGPAGTELQYLRFGTWSKNEGISKVPAHPLLDMTTMLKESECLTRFLAESSDSLPFPLRDRLEFWLLDDKRRNPLALLATSTERDHLPEERPYRWHCATQFSPDFAAPEWDEAHPIHPKDTMPTPHIDALNRLISIESGHAHTQWFERMPSGEGVAVPTAGIEGMNNRTLQPGLFPEVLIRENWSDCYDAALVASYVSWLSPVLLTLQNISYVRRVELEAQARHHALKVEKYWVSYPKILDQEAIDAARVEARLIRTNSRLNEGFT